VRRGEKVRKSGSKKTGGKRWQLLVSIRMGEKRRGYNSSKSPAKARAAKKTQSIGK